MSGTRKTFTLIALVILMGLLPSTCAFSYWVRNGNRVSTVEALAELERIVSDGTGGAVIVWKDYRQDDGDIYAQRVDSTGATKWTTDVPVCTFAGQQHNPALTSDGAGGAIITWEDQRSGAWHIYAQRVDASGTPLWTTNGVAICCVRGEQYRPQITFDGAGGAIIVWEDWQVGVMQIYAQRVNSSGTPLWAANGVAIAPTAIWQQKPQITPDGFGGAVVTWEQKTSIPMTYVDIYAQRVDADGNSLWSWEGVPHVPICGGINGGDSKKPDICSDMTGGAIIAWEDLRPGSSSYDIYVQRVNSSGTPLWNTNGLAVCTATGWQGNVDITSDGAAGAIMAWQDGRRGENDYDIFAHRVDGDGYLLWNVDSLGTRVTDAPYDQKYPKVCGNGSQGCIITWQDSRWFPGQELTPPDVYAELVDSDGGVGGWGILNDVAVSTVMGQELLPQIVPDGNGGAIITWQYWDYYPSIPGNVRAVRVWAEGSTVGYGTPIWGTCLGPRPWSGVKVASSDVVVSQGVTLAVLPGCRVRFAAGEDYGAGGIDASRCELIVEGTLTAQGNADALVFLQSAFDYSAAGQWWGVRLRPGSVNNVLGYCYIKAAENAIESYGSSLVTNSNIISLFGGVGIRVVGSTVTMDEDAIFLGGAGDAGIELDSTTTGTISYEYVTGTSVSGTCGIETKDSASPTIEHCTISGVDRGIVCGDFSTSEISRNNISAHCGVMCTGSSTPVMRYTTIQGIGGCTGVSIVDEANPDLGIQSDHGNNRFCPSTGFNYYVASLPTHTIMAEENWWGTARPSARKFIGGVDYDPWLPSDPGPGYAPPLVSLDVHLPKAPFAAQCYPNPSNPRTTIEYGVSEPLSPVRVVIYDVSGRVVKLLVNEAKAAGYYSVVWDGKSEAGEVVASGVYFYEVVVGNFRDIKKLIVLR